MTTDAEFAPGAQHLVLRAARRRWQVVAAGVAIGLIGGTALAFALPHRYTATAKIVVNSVPSDTPDQARPKATPEVIMGTEAQIARGSAVRDLAAQKYLPSSMPAHLLDSGLVVSVVPDSAVLQIAFTADKPKLAVAAAQAYAEAYLDNRSATARRFLEDVTQQLQSQVTQINGQVQRAQAARDKAPVGSAERRRQQAQITSLNQKLLSTENELARQQHSRIEPGTEITTPTSASRTGAKPLVLVGLGAVLGLMVGLAAATLRERTDPRLREAGDIQDDLGVPLLAVLPPHDPDGLLDPDSAAADAYRQLRNEIFLGPRPPVVLAVSRVDADTGTGDVTANLAVLLARSGRRVCVIDTDTGPRRLETLLEGVDRVGLVHAGLGADGLDAGIAVVTQREGVGQAKLGDMLASPLFGKLVEATRDEAEVVLIDAPPALGSAGQAVFTTADAVLLVVTRRRTRRDDVLSADDRIRRAGSRLVGTAVRESERVREAAPTRPPGEAQPAALPPAGRPELTGEPVAPAPPTAPTVDGPHVHVGTGAVYHPDGPPAAAAAAAAPGVDNDQGDPDAWEHPSRSAPGPAPATPRLEPQVPWHNAPPAPAAQPVGDAVPTPTPQPVPEPTEPTTQPTYAQTSNGHEHSATALGWPDFLTDDEDAAPIEGAISGLGWPQSLPAIETVPQPRATD